ncbi:MAG: hypothetical protein R3B38_00190 [Patescibacteria group bacterium]
MKKKYLFIGLVVIIGALYIAFNQNGFSSGPDGVVKVVDSAPSTWQTYTNTDLGFEIKYPKSLPPTNAPWTVESTGAQIGDPLHYSFNFSYPSTANPNAVTGWTVDVYENQSQVSLMRNSFNQFDDNQKMQTNFPITVNGMNAQVQNTEIVGESVKWVEVFIPVGKTTYVITGSSNAEAGLDVDTTFKDFWSSFRTL